MEEHEPCQMRRRADLRSRSRRRGERFRTRRSDE
jgi:hypothetical protein